MTRKVPEFDPHEGSAPAYVYARIAEHIERKIEVGELPPGARLPGERDLATQYKVGLGTVRRALDVLRGNGKLVTLKAKGTFVAPPAEPAGEDDKP